MSEFTFVLLTSKQMIQNLIFMKQYVLQDTRAFEILLITTEMMKSHNVGDTALKVFSQTFKLRYEGESRLIVAADDLGLIKKKLQDYVDTYKNKEYVVNITGGTKLMSLAAYSVFSSVPDSRLYYCPFGKEYMEMIYPEMQIVQMESGQRYLTLKEYLGMYEIGFTSRKKTLRDESQNLWYLNEVFLKYMQLDVKQVKGDSISLGLFMILKGSNPVKNRFKKKTIDLTDGEFVKKIVGKNPKKGAKGSGLAFEDIERINTFLRRAGFDPKNLSKHDLRYITGGWFEELVFFLIKKQYDLDDEQIGLSLEIKNTHNELDIVFIAPNSSLQIIECKSLIMGEKNTKDIISEALYKVSALRQDFGLSAQASIYTMNVIENESIKHRARALNVKLVCREDILEMVRQ